MTALASIVVQFGDPALADELVKVELDAEKNGESSSFAPGDTPFFLLHHAPTLRLAAITLTAGQVVEHGPVVLERSQQLLFAEAGPKELEYIPASAVAPTWYGRDGGRLTPSGASVIAAGPWPCLCLAAYQVNFQRLQLLPPALEMAEGETFPIAIILTMEAAS